MSPGRKVFCVLCNRSEETKVTGALSTKDEVTAHQNCLLFSSGIFCRNSPEFDDLFGFSVEDVMTEVKRGSKLYCNRCKQKGATAGCEVGRCKKSFHYPCAVQERAEITEDPDNGKYGLFCFKHHSQSSKYNGPVNGHGTSKNPSEAGTSQRNSNDDFAEARPVCSSDSNSHLHSKRRLNFNDRQEESRSKYKPAAKTRRISDSSHSDDNEPNTEMEIFAPLESDIDETTNSVPQNYLLTRPQFIRKDTECQTECTSGNQLNVKNEFENKDEGETTIDSDAESESLLPVEICTEATTSSTLSPQTVSTAYPKVILVKAAEEKKREDEGCSPDQHIAGPSAPQQSSTGAPPSPSPGHSKPDSVTGSPQCSSSAISPPPPESMCVSLISSSPCPKGCCFDPELIIDSPSFWKSCNVAGCTQAIFTDFINEMNDIASRIQSDQASQKDYDLALTVMAASGKLAELVAKQQKELQQKQMELTKAAAAMKEVVSALRR
ncbi:PHD finger protein 11 isoform X2 [Seriola dumerili]|uniref:PHD finger protein 11 isoform X2 n=1 Tax=Seriola dumerili TaxID=41447 RepID=UPI000BBEA47F|nr:PHD finger protein 11 isoform X2 [Seriola dumerili]